MHGRFGFSVRNKGGDEFFHFSWVFGLLAVNSNFSKKEIHLVTFRCSVIKTRINFLLLRKGDKGLHKGCTFLRCENILIQRRLIMMYIEINKDRRRRCMDDKPRIK